MTRPVTLENSVEVDGRLVARASALGVRRPWPRTIPTTLGNGNDFWYVRRGTLGLFYNQLRGRLTLRVTYD